MAAPGTGRRAAIGGGLGLATLGGAAPAQGDATRGSATLEMAEMTWPALRDAIAAGATTVILPTGGIEQNGPHMILGKHDHIVREGARRIAAALGGTLVAPVLSYVPQGSWDPPSGNFRWPGTLGVTPAAFEGVLEGAARSLRLAGFRAICLLGDNGASQAPQAALAARLDSAWRREGVRVLQVAAWYRAIGAQEAALQREGESMADIGTHAGILDTAELLAVHPAGVDLGRLGETRGAALEALGATGDPRRATAARGEALLAMRVAAALAEIRAALGRG